MSGLPSPYTVDMAAQARYAMEFCAVESCGKCTPCRIGSTRGVEVIDRPMAGENSAKQETILRDLCETMTYGSLCALGGLTPYPVLSAINHFPESGANVITTDNSDWATNCPEYKVTAVQATRVSQPSEWQKRFREFSVSKKISVIPATQILSGRLD